jgi:hypothetical protein
MFRFIALLLLLSACIPFVCGCENKNATRLNTSTAPSGKNADQSGNTAGGSLDLPK